MVNTAKYTTAIIIGAIIPPNNSPNLIHDLFKGVNIFELINPRAKNVKENITTTIKENAQPKNIKQVGLRLMKFCALYDMQRITDNAQAYAEPLQARYPVL